MVRRTLRVEKKLPGYPLDANTFNRRSLERLLTECGFDSPRWINATKDFANVLARHISNWSTGPDMAVDFRQISVTESAPGDVSPTTLVAGTTRE